MMSWAFRAMCFFLLCCISARAQSTQPAEAPKTGTFETKFTERSPMSTPDQIAKRLGLAKPEADYNLSSYEFIVHVPENYDPAKPLGVMYLLLYKDTNDPPRPCLSLFDERELIFVVAKSKNTTEAVRCGQALDVLHNLKKSYSIDETRSYLFAMWATDKECSNERIALSCGDVFSGLLLSEAMFYKEVPSEKKGYGNWPARFSPPPAASLATSRRRGIILEHRNVAEYSAVVQKGFEKDGFKFVMTLPSGPEELHYPNFSPDYLRKTFDFFESATAKVSAPAVQPPTKQVAPAVTQPSASKPAGSSLPPVSEPARMLKLAESYIAAGSYTQARARLKTIVEKYPTSAEATKAKGLLKQIEGK